MYRFGITTRITQAEGYIEPRDSLSQDWSEFFRTEFTNDLWVSIPNLGNDTVNYFHSLSLNVLILSGGDSIGETPKRDETEFALLEYALNNSIPVIAICRGMQLVHKCFGGEIDIGNENFTSIHRAKEHDILFKGNKIVQTNSFHNNIIVEASLNPCFRTIARCLRDNSIEGFMGKGVLGIMWHPERDMKDKQWSTELIKSFLQDYDESNNFSRG